MKLSKTVYFMLLASLLINLSCSKDKDEDKPTTEGLISFYRFQGNEIDDVGNNNGTGFNVEYSSVDDNNQCVMFNGLDSHVNLPYTFDYYSRTINLWFNVTDANEELSIIYSSDNPGLNFGLTILSVQQIEEQPYLIYNISNNLDTVAVELDTWYNATLEAQGMEFSYFLNNEEVNSGSFNEYISSYNGFIETILGCNRTMTQRFFNGMVDNLRIYNRKLSDHEIEVIYKAGL